MILPSLLRFNDVAAVAIAPVVRFVRSIRNRRAILRLCDLDERSLKDIGLTRTDVLGALAAPIGQDPSAILAEHVHGGGAISGARHIVAASASPALVPVTP